MQVLQVLPGKPGWSPRKTFSHRPLPERHRRAGERASRLSGREKSRPDCLPPSPMPRLDALRMGQNLEDSRDTFFSALAKRGVECEHGHSRYEICHWLWHKASGSQASALAPHLRRINEKNSGVLFGID